MVDLHVRPLLSPQVGPEPTGQPKDAHVLGVVAAPHGRTQEQFGRRQLPPEQHLKGLGLSARHNVRLFSSSISKRLPFLGSIKSLKLTRRSSSCSFGQLFSRIGGARGRPDLRSTPNNLTGTGLEMADFKGHYKMLLCHRHPVAHPSCSEAKR